MAEYLIGGAAIIVFGTILAVIATPFVIGYFITIGLWNLYDWIHEKFPKKKMEMRKMSAAEIKELEETKQKIKEDERKEKASLLLEFEELAKKKEELKKDIDKQTEMLEKMVKVVRIATYADPFSHGYDMRHTTNTLANFNISDIDNYERLKSKALEYERLTFRMFTINQKLKLLGLDYRVRGPYA
ncbi:MAG: hypothetical protein ABID61_03205 [Candidatus Micrarchaeota archaeon]